MSVVSTAFYLYDLRTTWRKKGLLPALKYISNFDCMQINTVVHNFLLRIIILIVIQFKQSISRSM